jgi:hypothetical protein
MAEPLINSFGVFCNRSINATTPRVMRRREAADKSRRSGDEHMPALRQRSHQLGRVAAHELLGAPGGKKKSRSPKITTPVVVNGASTLATPYHTATMALGSRTHCSNTGTSSARMAP